MAKKSSAARQAAAQRTQSAAKTGGAVLVRPQQQGAGAESGAATTGAQASAPTRTPGVALADAPTRVAPPAKSALSAGVKSSVVSKAKTPQPPPAAIVRPPKSAMSLTLPTRGAGQTGAAARPAPAPAATNASRGARNSAREQATRLARARATQRTRAANLITPEHYKYVLTDLRLIGAVAILFAVFLIVMHFVLPQ